MFFVTFVQKCQICVIYENPGVQSFVVHVHLLIKISQQQEWKFGDMEAFQDSHAFTDHTSVVLMFIIIKIKVHDKASSER